MRALVVFVNKIIGVGMIVSMSTRLPSMMMIVTVGALRLRRW